MGILSWIIAGLAAFAACRFIGLARAHWLAEIGCAALAALAAGFWATAADFGGWAELDARAMAFCLLAAVSAIAVTRLAVLARRPV